MSLRRQLLLILILALAGCAAPTPQPTATPTLTPSPPAVETPTPTSGLAPGVDLVASIPAFNGDLYSFSWAPSGARLAFFSQDGLQIAEAPLFEPRIIAEQFSGLRLLGGNTGPLWSPSGDRIAFTSPTTLPNKEWQPLSIWLVNADGSGLRDLLPGEKAVLSVSTAKILIEWLDDETLAFREHMGTGVDALYLLNVESGELTDLAGTEQSRFPGVYAVEYRWAPDDQHVAAVRWGRGLPELVLLDMAKTTSREAPFNWERFEGWSPQGDRFLFTAWEDMGFPVAAARFDLYIGSLAALDESQILMPNAASAAWSPDGSLLAFYLVGQPIYDEEGKLIGTNFTVGQPMRELALFFMVYDLHTRLSAMGHIMASDPGDFRDPLEVWNWLLAHKPVWSPDGKSVAFWDVRDGVYLYTTSLISNDRIPLAFADAQVTSAAWSPDGEFLALATAGDVESWEPGTLWIIKPPYRQEIGWDEAVDLVMSGQVAEVLQTHQREVFLTLRNGVLLKTVEPEIDNIFEVVERCGAACRDMVLGSQ